MKKVSWFKQTIGPLAFGRIARRSTSSIRAKANRILAEAFCLGLCLMLVVQGFGFVSSTYGQSRVGGTRSEDAGVSSKRVIRPTDRGITLIGTANMKELSSRRALSPATDEPVELKAIHPPQSAPPRSTRPPGKKPPRSSGADRVEPQSPIPTVPSPPVTLTFKSDDFSLGVIPPDTMGAVGLNHAVTTTNDEVVIHSRAGVELARATLDAFWGGAFNTFDPKVLYDRFNDRFIVVSVANSFDPTSMTLVGVSVTGDPTGLFHLYSIDADATATPAGGAWADYPSFGFNKNWITVSINRFGFGSVSGYQGPSIYVLNKAAAYAGTLASVNVFEDSFISGCLALPPASQITALGCGFTYVPAITEDNTTDTEFMTEDWDSQAGQLRMTRVNGPVGTPTVTVGYQFPQSEFAWRFNSSLISGSGGYVPQRQQNIYLPSGSRPTANDSRIQNAVLRNGSFWTTHHVMLARLQTPAGTAVGGSANPDIRSAVQWWQLNPNLSDSGTGTPPIQRNVIADPRADNCHNGTGGTRAGCTTATQVGDFYAYPTIAVNAANDVVIGYSRFSPFTLPKGAYSFRAGTDPLNTMRDSMVFREGQGNYNIGAGSPFNIRWGDYSSTMVDPVNDTDFWTIQEWANYQEEIFGPGGFAGNWSTWYGVIKPSSTSNMSACGGLMISEFRLRGPAGTRDEFVELFNPSTSALTITSTDASDGWTLVHSSSGGTLTPLATIPNGTVIPGKGHYLITNEVRATGLAPYSMSANPTGNPVRTADSDAMWTPDIADNGGLALFCTARQSNFVEGARVDAVGYAALAADSIFKEGTGLPNCAGAPSALPAQLSFVRKGTAGNPQDTGDNAADFDYISTNGAVQTQICQPVLLGTPSPLNADSPPSP